MTAAAVLSTMQIIRQPRTGSRLDHVAITGVFPPRLEPPRISEAGTGSRSPQARPACGPARGPEHRAAARRGPRAEAPSWGAPVRPAGDLPPASGGAGPESRP